MTSMFYCFTRLNKTDMNIFKRNLTTFGFLFFFLFKIKLLIQTCQFCLIKVIISECKIEMQVR